MSAQPSTTTAKSGKRNTAWEKKVVQDAKAAIRTDPAYFTSMLDALARFRAKEGMSVVS